MASSSNVMDFKSSCNHEINDISPTQSPVNDILEKSENQSNSIDFKESPFKKLNSSLTEFGRPSLLFKDLNSSDNLARESLGILSKSALATEFLDFSNIDINEALDSSMLSCRESLGILNISALDIGRESIGIYDVQKTFLAPNGLENDELRNHFDFNLDNFNFNHIENGSNIFNKIALEKDSALPSTSTTQDKKNSLSSTTFQFPHWRLLSEVSHPSSSVSVNPYFNSRSLDTSPRSKKYSVGFSNKDSEAKLTDPFGKEFQISTTDDRNKHSISLLPSIRCEGSFSSEIDKLRNRIHPLPVNLEDENKFLDYDFKASKFNDDLFSLEAKKVVGLIADTSFVNEETSFEIRENYILDSTPQPEWPVDPDSSYSNVEDKINSPKCCEETILKQVDKMLGMQPVNINEKLKLKPPDKTENISHTIGQISRNSLEGGSESQSCTSNNFSQNISKISRASQEKEGQGMNQTNESSNFENHRKHIQANTEIVMSVMHMVSDCLNKNENISEAEKEKNAENCILELKAYLMRVTKGKGTSCEDSGHSSVEDQDQNSGEVKNELETESQALDLSCKNKSCSGEINKKLSMSKSPAHSEFTSSQLAKSQNQVSLVNASSNSVASKASDTSSKNNSKINKSTTSNQSNGSVKSSNASSSSRQSNISQTRSSLSDAKIRKSKVGVVVCKKGPLRAVLPLENMAKVPKPTSKISHLSVTPKRGELVPKFGSRTKKTSTPINESKLRPMAASTPTVLETEVNKEIVVSPLARPKYSSRSFSCQPRPSSKVPENIPKTRHSSPSLTKTVIGKPKSSLESGKLLRRNSLTEGTLTKQKDAEGPTRLKRTFSTGKETKIITALNKAKQNISYSPHYQSRATSAGHGEVLAENVDNNRTELKKNGFVLKRLSSIVQKRKTGKENQNV